MTDQPIAPMTEISTTYEGGMRVTTESNLDAARQQVMRQSGHVEQFRPDFIMVGIQHDTGVMLFASTDLTEAELKREMRGFNRVPISESGIIARVPEVLATVTAQLKTFTVIQADDYPSALATLQDLWKRKNPAGDSGLPAISG